MKINETKIKGCFVIERDFYRDERGYFSRAFCKKTLEKYYINTRLNKSLDSYYSDLKTSLSYLNNRKSENIIKNL